MTQTDAEKKMTGLLFGLKNKTKKVAEVLPILNLIKREHPAIHAEYQKKYIDIVRELNKE
jgi:hypothetical protein